jgi:cell division protein FtsW
MVSRAERSPFADWWWTVDRWLLTGLGALMVLGIVLTMAGSPPVAERLGLSSFHFVNRQVFFLAVCAVALGLCSFMPPRYVRRAALLIYVVGMGLVVAALIYGVEVKGAKRWIFSIQPSEFVKPAFVILAAWAFSEGARRRDVPGTMIAIALLPLTIVPLVLQPDIGQTILLSTVWAALFFMAGLHYLWVAGIGALGATAVVFAYRYIAHVRSRIDKFVDPTAGGGNASDTFQIDTAMDSFISGGWFGKGPGEGTMKRILPDSHTDFIFAVTGEEFGVLFCIFIVLIFAMIVLRGLHIASKNEDPFCRFAAAGLVVLFGVQSAINMAVNLHLMPAKGMTLPFISYGGSSMISLGIGMGFLIAVTRRRPRAEIARPVSAS